MDTRTDRPISENERNLAIAAEFGITSAIRRLVVDEHVDINAMVTNSGKTALQIALERKLLEDFKFLLQLGANPAQPCMDGLEVTPLHLAAAMSDERFITELMTAKVDVDPNVMMSNGMTPIFFAAKHGRGLNTELLIKHKASLFRRSANGDSPLSLAIESDHQRTINTIVNAMIAKHGADTLLKLFKFNDYLRHSFEKATSEDAVKSLFKLIDVLLKADVPTEEIQSLLPDRVTASATLNTLIQAQLDTRLAIAAKAGNLSSVKTLVACGANVFFRDQRGYGQSSVDHAMSQLPEMLSILLGSDKANTAEFQSRLWVSMIQHIGGIMPPETVETILSRMLAPEFNLAKIAEDKNNLRHFGGMFAGIRSNAKVFLNVYNIYKRMESLNISREDLKLMVPANNSDYIKYYATDIKENLLHEIKLLPPQQRLEMCLAAENPDDLLGHVMQMQRGAQKCRPGHGILKAIAEVKAGALAQGAKIPDASSINLQVVIPNTGFEDITARIKDVISKIKPLTQLELDAVLANLRKTTSSNPIPQTSNLKTSELNARLLEAARFDNAASIQTLIAQGAEVNAHHEPYGQTALDCAAAYGSLNAMRALIASGAEVNLGRRDDPRKTPLYFAAQYGQTKVAAVLLENKADANICAGASRSPLTLAINANNKELIEILLKHGANPYQVTGLALTPLEEAAKVHSGILEAVVNHIIPKDITAADIEALSRNNLLYPCFDVNKEPGQKRDLLFKIIEKLLLQKVSLNVIKKLIPENLAPAEKYKRLEQITAINEAIKKNDMATVILLALRPGNAKIINPENNTYNNPLHVAIDNRNLAAARLLLALGASPATTLERNNNPLIGYGYRYSDSMLMHACLHSSKEMVQLLLDNGADPYFVNRSVSALALAAAGQRHDMVKLLVDRLLAIGDPKKIIEILSKENNFRFAISHAANTETFSELYRLVDYLLEQKIDYSVIKELLPDKNCLWKKAKQDKVDYINPEFKNFSMERIKALPFVERIQACHQALDSNHPLGHIMFMARGSIRCKLGHGMLKEIADLRDAAILEQQQQLPKLNDDLHDAARTGDLDKVVELIKQGADVNARTSKDLTMPLIIAAYEGKKDVVELLLKHGADVNAAITKGEDKQIGARALFAATESGHTDIVELLLKHGADINAATRLLNLTPLFRAASNGNSELVSLLLSRGANFYIGALGENKFALNVAISNDHIETAGLLAAHLLKSSGPAMILEFLQSQNNLQSALTRAKSASAALIMMRIVSHLLNHSVSIDTIKAMLPTGTIEMEKHDADNVVAQALIQLFKNPDQFTKEKVNELTSASTDAELVSRAQAQLQKNAETKPELPAPVAAKTVETVAAPVVIPAPVESTPHMYPKFSDFGISQESMDAAKATTIPLSTPLVTNPMESANHAIAAQQSVFDLLFGNTDTPSNLATPMQPTPIVLPSSPAAKINNGTLFSLDQPVVTTEIRRDPVLESQLAQLEEVFASTSVAQTEDPLTIATAVAGMTEAEVEEQFAKLDSMFNRTSPVMFRAPDTKQDAKEPTKQKNATPTKHTKQAVLL